MQKDVLVIGGGVAGMQAALELAGAGYYVQLITDEANLGGKLANSSGQKDDAPCVWSRQANTPALYLGGNLHSSGTILGSLIARTWNDPRINVITGAKLISFKGEAGDFSAVIGDAETGGQLRELPVGAVILATGFNMYDAAQKGEFGYGYHKNVVTSLEYERMLAANRYKSSLIERPSDRKIAERIAFIQCVGSRDVVSKGEYCSAICCMFTVKEAILTKEYSPKADVTVFYLDVRSCGKNFDAFYKRAEELGARYVRTMISEVKEDPVTENLSVRYISDGKAFKEEFDLVVLATGVRPPERLAETANILKIPLNEFGFVATDKFNPVSTGCKGVFSVGGSQGPLDVAESIALASAASASVVKEMGAAERILSKPVKERDVSKEEVRLGVFLCQAGMEAMGANAEEVLSAVKESTDISFVEYHESLCLPEPIGEIQKKIAKESLNRLVFSPCILKHNLTLFQDAAQAGGLNRMLVEMAAVPHVNWEENRDKAVKEAVSLTEKAIADVKNYKPLLWHTEQVVKRALIVGGGITGMTAALALADRGFPSTLVEKEDELGGHLINLKGTPDNDEARKIAADMARKVNENEKIEVIVKAEITDFSGRQGSFRTTVAVGGESEKEIEHGVVILATGTSGCRPSEYLYGQDERVVTGTEALNLLAEDGIISKGSGSTYVFIQCVGSRTYSNGKAYCSQSCCQESIASAVRIKELDPDAKVYVLARDVRTPGYMELKYKEARKLGVIFVHYKEDDKPKVFLENDGSLRLSAVDPASGKRLEIKPDKVILASAQKAADGSEKLARLFKIQINQDGFLAETHAEFGTISFPGGGIFIAGASHAPKGVTECLIQAWGAAGRASRVLSRPVLMMGGVVAEVEWEKCAACLTCVRTCPYSVPKVSPGKKEMGTAYIQSADCRGCGICASECPNKAIFLHHYQDGDMLARLERALTEVG